MQLDLVVFYISNILKSTFFKSIKVGVLMDLTTVLAMNGLQIG